MRRIDGDRFRQNEPIAIALVPSRRDQVPEPLARFGQSCRKLYMTGSCGWSLPIRCEKQARASPKPKGGARRVCSSARGNQPAGSAGRAGRAEMTDRKGWPKLDGSQRGRDQPGLIRQDPVFVRRLHGSDRGHPVSLGAGKRLAPGALKTSDQ